VVCEKLKPWYNIGKQKPITKTKMVNENPTPEEQPKKGGKWKIIVGVLVVVVVIGAVVLGGQGGLFQGKVFDLSGENSYSGGVSFDVGILRNASVPPVLCTASSPGVCLREAGNTYYDTGDEACDSNVGIDTICSGVQSTLDGSSYTPVACDASISTLPADAMIEAVCELAPAPPADDFPDDPAPPCDNDDGIVCMKDIGESTFRFDTAEEACSQNPSGFTSCLAVEMSCDDISDQSTCDRSLSGEYSNLPPDDFQIMSDICKVEALCEQPAAPANTAQGVLTTALSAVSPSGNRMVTVIDNVASFDLCATDNFVTVTGVRLVISGVLELPVVEIKDGNTVLGTTNDWSTLNDLYIDTSFGSDLVITEGTCRTVSVNLDSTELINTHSGMDDVFQVGLEDVFTTGNVFFQNTPVGAHELLY
jgi:hypothetical protein